MVHKLTAGKKQWTLVRTDGVPTDTGVVSEDVEKLTWKSDISTPKPTKVVTPDESEVIFEILLLETPRGWKVDYGVPLVFIVAGLFFGEFTEQFFEWFFFGGVLLGCLASTAAHVLKNPSYEVTDGSGVRIGLVIYDRIASIRLETFVIETSTGRWRLVEASLRHKIRRNASKARIYAIAGLTTVLSVFYNVNEYILLVAVTLVSILAASIWNIRKRWKLKNTGLVDHRFLITEAPNRTSLVQLPGTEPVKHCLTLINETGTQVGHWSFADIDKSRSYDIRVDDSRLGPRVAAAVALIVAGNYEV